MCIDDQFTDSFRRQFISFFSQQTFDFSPKSNIPKHKFYRFVYLLINRTVILLFINKNRSVLSFENSTLRFRKVKIIGCFSIEMFKVNCKVYELSYYLSESSFHNALTKYYQRFHIISLCCFTFYIFFINVNIFLPSLFS